MRRALIAVVGLIVLLASAHTLAWRWAARRMEQELSAWTVARRAQGWTITHGQPISGGWPFAVELSVADAFASGGQPDVPGGLTWSADRVRLRVALLHPRVLVVVVEGQERLRLGDGPDIAFTADRLRASIPYEPGLPVRAVELVAGDLRAGLPGSAGPDALTVALVQLHAETRPAAPQGEPAISFSASAQDVGLPAAEPGRALLGPRIAAVSVGGAVSGPLPRVPGLAARAAQWRDGGGTLELSRFALDWGALRLNGTATIALDERMQPMGAANAHLSGQAEALDALADNHAISSGAATAAKAVLSLMARPRAEDGPPEVDVPLTIQDRTLAMGRIPLARLPELVWPGPP